MGCCRPLEHAAGNVYDRRGDCEDYAIAKYVALRATGIAEDDVKRIVVSDIATAEDHVVVSVRLEDGWVILDNRWLTLVPDNQVWRVTPLFVLDDSGVRQFVNSAPVAKRQEIVPGTF